MAVAQPIDSNTNQVTTSGQTDLDLRLVLRDPEVVAELSQYPAGPAREEFARGALRIGVLALRQANGVVDAEKIQREVGRLMADLGSALGQHAATLKQELARSLSAYFDPATGQLPQRLTQLVGKDGELQRVLASQLDGDSSAMARTLARHVGDQSPLLRMLSPTEKTGVLSALTTSVEGLLQQERERILAEFTLDNNDSALSRLVAEITGANGELEKELRDDLARVRAEFSLDNDAGALARLVGRVEKVQAEVAAQFSHDNPASGLSRMTALLQGTHDEIKKRLSLDDASSPLALLQRQLLEVVDRVSRSQQEFQTEIREAVASLKATRAEAAQSTRHGRTFEEAVGSFVAEDARRRNDLHEPVGATTGSIRNCKKGDHLLILGPDAHAAGARIVIEAKANRSVTLPDALTELEESRRNRQGQVGVFVYAEGLQPEGLEPIERYGSDIVVVWDSEDATTDSRLRLALTVARLIAVQQAPDTEGPEIDLPAIDKAMAQIRRDITDLDEIGRWSETVRSNGDKIASKAGLIRTRIEKQLAALEAEHLKLKAIARDSEG